MTSSHRPTNHLVVNAKNNIANKAKHYTPTEEFWHALTHGLGALCSIIGIIFLIRAGVKMGDIWLLVGMIIFGISLLAMFTTSTLYHSFKNFSLKAKMRIADHAAIYLLIAGTYTPFALGNLRPNWGIPLVVIIWLLACVGVIYKLFLKGKLDKYGWLDTGAYIGMGCVALLFTKPMLEHIHLGGIALLAGGGLLYIIGTIFYRWDKLAYNHTIWHLFVIGGAAAHYFSILYFAQSPIAA